MARFYADRVAFDSATTGTGNLSPGSALNDSFVAPSETSIQNNDTVYLLIQEGLDFEICDATYVSAGPHFTRDTVLVSKIGGTVGTSKMNLGGTQKVRFVAPAALFPVNLANNVTGTLPFANFVDGSALSVTGRSANSTGVQASIAAGTDGHVLRRSGTSLGFGTVAAGAFATGPGVVTPDMLNNGSALSLLGVTGNSAAARADIAAASDHQVMRRSGTAVAFGAVNLASSNAVTGVLPLANGGLEALSADRTYFVRADGNNNNTGLVDNSGGAFLTIQKAVDTVAGLNLNGKNVTIQVRSGTYTAGAVVAGPWIGVGNVTLLGDTTTPGNVIINVTGFGILVSSGGRLLVGGFDIRTATFGSALAAVTGGVARVTGAMRYGACAYAALEAGDGGTVVVDSGNYTVAGNAFWHMWAYRQGNVSVGAVTATMSGTPAFSVATAQADNLSLIVSTVTFSGAATGTRYSSTLNSVINTAGGGASHFPGNAAGSTDTGGQYL